MNTSMIEVFFTVSYVLNFDSSQSCDPASRAHFFNLICLPLSTFCVLRVFTHLLGLHKFYFIFIRSRPTYVWVKRYVCLETPLYWEKMTLLLQSLSRLVLRTILYGVHKASGYLEIREVRARKRSEDMAVSAFHLILPTCAP